ncbi:MAG: ATP-binding cassette domain-containing protein [Bacteroidota bacterium]
MIELRNVNKIFNEGSLNSLLALKDINLKIEKGEFLILLGSNGSGKSTLINIIAGSTSVSSGTVLIEGNKVNHLKDFERSKWIARIFQNPLMGTAPDLSIIDNFRLASLRTQSKKLMLGITNKFRSEVQEKISLLNMGLENKLDSAVGSLSGGQRQALTLSMAVMDDAKILLMDEPTAALDPKSSELLMNNAVKFISLFGFTTIFITHHLKDAHQYGNRVIQMHDGKIIRDIRSAEKEKLQLNDMYGWFD